MTRGEERRGEEKKVNLIWKEEVIWYYRVSQYGIPVFNKYILEAKYNLKLGPFRALAYSINQRVQRKYGAQAE